MKHAVYFVALLAFIGNNAFAQSNSVIAQIDNNKVEQILTQKSYNIDLATYKKAKLIVESLLSETNLSDQGIITVLDDMVSDPAPVMYQILVRFHDLPLYNDTGNPTLDTENYNKAKKDWIKNNPQKHQRLRESQNPQN